MKTIYKHDCASCGAPEFGFRQGSHVTGSEYQWVCEACGTHMSIIFSDEGRSAQQRPTGRRCDRTLALFEVRGFPSMRFIYHGYAWDGDLDHDYYYNEHTCPTNLLRCEEIFIDGEIDPHGAFRLIKEVFVTGPSAMPRDDAEEMLCELARTHVSEESNAASSPARVGGSGATAVLDSEPLPEK